MATYHVIGKPLGRLDGVDKVTRTGRYSADHPLPGMLWGKSLHSSYPHARILKIDTSAAKALPGVHAVITADDIRFGPWGRAIKDVPVLAQDRLRFIGERVAAVAELAKAGATFVTVPALGMLQLGADQFRRGVQVALAD
jgi:CO/xanthine dehydrogenase Mo-binding subunit